MAAHANITRRSILKSATAISLAVPTISVVEAAETNHPDYALLKWADDLDAAQIAFERVCIETTGCAYGSPEHLRYEAAFDACSHIADEIEPLQARTLDGLRAKARAIDWCHAYTGDGICLNENMTQDVRLAHQIIAALLQA